ncbi:hypothetical protein Q765_08780 [Flavobacterium rivuli WB 3.3-2 = DSM 21788]|uniref:Uncharacterized protein n=1 Tax=Flavobacterium rivuli WB 3.3-2 = DSM 21788 TaxID=1121895 RepID=A0A0A2M394_9FLAO|nr:hypothetical protein [Flavobacterium rivuli]KGO86714.1 hypothetical protein Q765_08780 [Flavobacterium rivuli WB 3.3-2 = DSM 21788]
MNDYIFNLEKEFQAYLPEGYYTFIGPAHQELLGDFTSVVNLVAPANNIARTINNTLSNKKAVKQVLSALYHDAELKVYVVEGDSPYGLVYTTVEEYCERADIQFRSLSS